MSKIAISGAATGTATFTIESPATSTNRTLTLPDNTGTIITQNSTPAFASTIGVGGATAAASGAGITFPATQSASSDANTLDDYEEGTWTPALLNGTTTTYTSQSATYTKVGRLVFVRAQLIINSVGNGNTIRVSGLPFAAAAVGCPGTFAVGYFASLANNKIYVVGYVRNAETNADFYSSGSSAADLGDTAIFGNGTRVDFAGCYQV